MSLDELTYLVVEDNDFQRRWLVAMLGNLGAQRIIEAADGCTALQILEDPARGVDICFIDLNMPGMDGMELIRHMGKSANPVSIVLASALDPALVFSVESMSHAYGVNLLGTIVKPATPGSLQTLIARHVPAQVRRDLAASNMPVFTLQDILQGVQENQFAPYFQPKVELADGKVKGVEAFARWRHPQFGLVSANAFIPVLEQHHQMQALTWSMIRQSAAACRDLHAQGHPLSMSINLDAGPLTDVSFADQFAACMAEHGVAPHCMTIEVTESASKIDIPAFLENLARLRMKGFILAVDDYGTGDTNMQHHLRIPFSELKIDRSFVVGAAQNEALALALASSLELAQKLKRESTAVGVGTRQDWELLQKLGCTNAQGYFIAKPMEAHALPSWMAEWAHFF